MKRPEDAIEKEKCQSVSVLEIRNLVSQVANEWGIHDLHVVSQWWSAPHSRSLQPSYDSLLIRNPYTQLRT